MKKYVGARSKLKRAKYHIKEFIARAKKQYDRDQPRFSIEDDAVRRQRTLLANIDIAIPDALPLIIGDAIHNLRSALDHLVWEIVSPFNPVARKVQFPFCKNAEQLNAALKESQILLAGEGIAGRFRELKPYPGGNDLLCGLHSLDITDKHILIVPVRSIIGIDRLDVRDLDPSAPEFIIEKRSFDLSKDNRLAIWRYDPAIPWRDPERPKPIDIAFQILFRKGQPFEGRSVAAVLDELAQEVDRTIAVFSV